MTVYGFSINLNDSFEDVISRVTDVLRDQGFGILTEIDVMAIMKASLDADRLPYTILGAFNPTLARHALEVNPDIGLLLPYNIVVRGENDGSVTITFMNPAEMLRRMDKLGVGVLAGEMRSRLQGIRGALMESGVA